MDVVKLTQELVKINSEDPPGNEENVARFIVKFMKGTDFKLTKIYPEKNRPILIFEKGKGEGLMLNGHMDTVPVGNNWKYDPFGGKLVKGKLYGRGAVDMKGGLASILIAAKNFSGKKFKRRLVLVFVPGEEVNLLGSDYLTSKKRELISDIKYGLIAEPTGMNIEIAQKGIVQVNVIFKGKSAHGSMPELGDNAILKAVKFINELEKLTKKLKRKKNKILGSGTINVGKINGGIKVNMVPDFCKVEIDRRIIPGETINLAKKQIREILKRLNLKAKVEFVAGRPAMVISKKSEIVNIMKGILKKRFIGSSGYTEAELYYTRCGIDCVVCGPGNEKLCHVANEYNEVKQLRSAVEAYEKLIKMWCL